MRRLLVAAGFFTAIAWAGENYLQEAQTYLEQGKLRAAVIQLKNHLRKNPLDAEARLLLGQTYLRQGDAAGAVKELEKARDGGLAPERWLEPLGRAYLLQNRPRKVLDGIQPDQVEDPVLKAKLHALRGEAHLQRRELEAAGRDFAAALKLAPRLPEGRLGRARLALAQGQPEQALKEVEPLLQGEETPPAAYLIAMEAKRQLGDLEGAYAAATQALEAQPGNLRALLGRAAVAIAQGRTQEAAADLEKAAGIAADAPLLHYLQGLLAFREGRLDQAKENLTRVINRVPSHLPSKLLLGMIAYRQNELAAAEEYLEAVRARKPDQVAVAKVLGAVKLKRGRPEDAVALLEPYLDRHPDDPQLLALLGSAYLQQRKFDRATELLGRAAELAPDVAAIRTQLALGKIAGGDLEAAAGELEQAVSLEPELVQADVMLVLTRLRQKRYDEALAVARKMAAAMPDNPMPANLIAGVLMAKGDKAGAERQWREAIARFPDYVTARLNLARLKVAQGKLDEAESLYRTILQQHPRHVMALIGLAQIAEARKDLKAMRDYLEKAHDSDPQRPEPAVMLARYHLSRNQGLEAVGVLRPVLEKHPDHPLALLLTAQGQLAAGQAASAAATLRRLVAKRPDNAMALYRLGVAEQRNGAPEAALTAWERALQLKPDFLPATVARLRLLLEQKRYDEALAAAKELQTRFPERAEGYFWAGQVALAQKDYAAALKALETAHRRQPGPVTAQQLFFLKRQLGKADEARRFLQDWLAKHPDDTGAWLRLALAEQADGRPQAAIAAYEKVLAASPENVVARNNLTWLYQQLGDAKALESARRLQALAQGRPEILDTVGWVYLRQGRVGEALPILQDAAVKAPHLPNIRLHWAEALAAAGRAHEAGLELKRLLQRHPDFPERKQAEALLKRLNAD
ncbi:cellulose synthase operon protein C [Methylomarinovum caldicuralii]|uniref:Cellulose synthase operon protein C n=1 Tax=Methylomarinovum caldicuralii TaxID=438856 RepID=A0AAU9CRQ1_9GAMM|nr:XrtA/PEP-CTERM system TPR-repeat protein PrsT [Methylomarinovum caldicuralii]BCX82643.1 cellulose synthase operon protein C [Methylomarinovum caldicuralii]